MAASTFICKDLAARK